MEKGTIYKEKKTSTCYICVEATSDGYSYLLDICGNSMSGHLKEEYFVKATDDDILCDAKVNFRYILNDNSPEIWQVMTEYNLSNPSVAEEERMIQDRIDEEYVRQEEEKRAYYKAMEEEYYKAMENKLWNHLEEYYWYWQQWYWEHCFFLRQYSSVQ